MGAPAVFPSRVDAWLVVVVAGGFGVALYGGLADVTSDPSTWVTAFAGVVILVVIVAGLAVPCRYTLAADHLLIESGLLYRQRIPYRDISAVELSSNPLAAPALSLRRVKVSYGRRFQLVSPRDRDEFVRQLKGRVDLARALRT
ncbi:MAG: PH domain-containing protein [Thermoleophilia bacterium]